MSSCIRRLRIRDMSGTEDAQKYDMTSVYVDKKCRVS